MSETLEYNGDLAPGETVVVDAETLEISKDDIVDYDNFSGDLLHLLAGDNTITYTDEETSRTIEIEISKRDRHA